jgi:hypothetical protein
MTTLAIILGLLVAPLALGEILNRIVGRTVANAEQLGCIGLTLVFCFTGVGHFILTEPMAKMLPPWCRGELRLSTPRASSRSLPPLPC